MYTYLDNYFNNTSLKIKIEIYLLSLLIAYFFYYFSQNLYFQDEDFFSTKIKIDDFNKSFNGSYLELFSDLEFLANKNEVIIDNLSREKNMIILMGNISINKTSTFISEIEHMNNFTKIDFLSLNKKENSLNHNFELKINLNKFYIKDKIKQNIQIKNQNSNNFRVKAIVFNYVLINDNWIKEGEKIENYELTEIKNNFVILKKDDEKIKLELSNE